LVLGAIDLPLIRFSVEWWQTLHQPASVLRRGGVAMPNSMLSPLLWMALAYSGYGLLLFRWRLLTLLRRHKQRAASWRLMQAPPPPQPKPKQDSAP
jgi:heme exporter protein C